MSLCQIFAAQPDDPYGYYHKRPNSDCNQDGSFKPYQIDFEDEEYSEKDQPVIISTNKYGNEQKNGQDYCVSPWRGRSLAEADNKTDCQKVIDQAFAEPDKEAHPCWHAEWKVYLYMEELAKTGSYGGGWQSSSYLHPVRCQDNGLFEVEQYIDRDPYCFHEKTGKPLGSPPCPEDVEESNCLENVYYGRDRWGNKLLNETYPRFKCAEDGSGHYAKYQAGTHWTGHPITYCVTRRTGVRLPCDGNEAIRAAGIWDDVW